MASCFFKIFVLNWMIFWGWNFRASKFGGVKKKRQISGSISEKCPVTGLKASQLPLKNFPPFEKRKLREHCSKSCLVMCPYMFCQVGSQALFKERVSAILWRGMLLLLNKVYARPAYRSLHETLDKQMIGRNDSHQHLEEEILRWWYFNQASIFLARVSVLHGSQIWNLVINMKIYDFVVKTFYRLKPICTAVQGQITRHTGSGVRNRNSFMSNKFFSVIGIGWNHP